MGSALVKTRWGVLVDRCLLAEKRPITEVVGPGP
jgi:hypothetical protein